MVSVSEHALVGREFSSIDNPVIGCMASELVAITLEMCPVLSEERMDYLLSTYQEGGASDGMIRRFDLAYQRILNFRNDGELKFQLHKNDLAQMNIHGFTDGLEDLLSSFVNDYSGFRPERDVYQRVVLVKGVGGMLHANEIMEVLLAGGFDDLIGFET